MKIINKKILFAIGMTVGTMFGFREQEIFLDCSRPVTRDTAKRMVPYLIGGSIDEVLQNEIDKVFSKIEGQFRIIDHKSLIESETIKELDKKIIKACGKSLLREIHRLEEMSLDGLYEVSDGWVDFKASKRGGCRFSVADICNFKKALRRLIEEDAGKQTFIWALMLDTFCDPVLFEKTEECRCSAFEVTPQGINKIFLHFSPYLYTEICEMYHEFNHYIHSVLGLCVDEAIVGDFSTPFGNKFLGYAEYDHYDMDLNIRRATGIWDKSVKFSRPLRIFDVCFNKWTHLEEMFNTIGYAIIKHPKENRCINYICSFSDANLLQKCVFWGHNGSREKLSTHFLCKYIVL